MKERTFVIVNIKAHSMKARLPSNTFMKSGATAHQTKDSKYGMANAEIKGTELSSDILRFK
ncbi:hypothetical protein FACS1894218_6210 [Bacilli bacterium]|nr:hypothetical protein FACS1894218_6210 [Bacilli bacterium]